MDKLTTVLIRPWREGDDQGIWTVLQEGSYSNVNSTFMLCFQRNEILILGSILPLIGLACGCSWLWIVFSVIIFLMSLYMLSFLSALLYLYGSTLSDIRNIPDSYFNSPDDHFWVAECNGEIAGTIAVTRKVSQLKGSPDNVLSNGNIANSRKVAWLRRMAVGKRYRGLGIAKRLVKECLSYCREQKYDSVFLITTEVHHAARSLYFNLGFNLIACKPYKYLRNLITVNTYEFEIEL